MTATPSATWSARGYFADAKREQARRRLPVVAKDLFKLVSQFEQDKEVRELDSYRLLVRLFEEQCEVEEESKAEAPVRLRDGKSAAATVRRAVAGRSGVGGSTRRPGPDRVPDRAAEVCQDRRPRGGSCPDTPVP